MFCCFCTVNWIWVTANRLCDYETLKAKFYQVLLLPASVGLTSYTLQMLLLSNVASKFFTSFTLRELFNIYIQGKALRTDSRGYLPVRECHLNNYYPSLVLVILCIHKRLSLRGGRMILLHQEEVDLLKTVVLFPRVFPHPPAPCTSRDGASWFSRWSGTPRSQNLHHTLFCRPACFTGSRPIWAPDWVCVG